ncbi:uncharacterized protein LOC141855986 isoform X2 [Brevipalpus obovatus]|uniref:uncharacterized protein LOC141855986 isoform X2 n=1 Tax=Brevipalpus obovatus TaxID=246614 RepID=UPI003D9DFBA6
MSNIKVDQTLGSLSSFIQAKGTKKGPKKAIVKLVKTKLPKNKFVIALGPTPPPPTKKPIIVTTTTPKPPAEKQLCEVPIEPTDIFILSIVRKINGNTVALPPIVLDHKMLSFSFWIENGIGFAHQLKKWSLFGNKYQDNVSFQVTLKPTMVKSLPKLYKKDFIVLTIISTFQGRTRVRSHLIDVVGVQRM